ncbi:MAG: hypothetical protein AB1582_07385 [Pseudomonadota bacterium]
MLGDVAEALRTVQAIDRNPKTIRVAEKAENLCQLNRTFFLEPASILTHPRTILTSV